MGDRVSMEINRKKKSLTGIFLRFAVSFCVNTLLIALAGLLFLMAASRVGVVLPANHAEKLLTENMSRIQSAGEETERWIPGGCTYGIYDAEGTWKAGSFPPGEREEAWSQYEKEDIFVSTGNYYRFIRQDGGDICIVRYDLYMKYARESLNGRLPKPEHLSFVLDGVLFILHAVLLARYFAGKLNRQLAELSLVTEKIAQNDLEFTVSGSDIREMNEVLLSLSRMKEVLRASLTAQWDMEQQRKEQLSALAHDIRTPLTIIRGNAELLAEDMSTPESRECTDAVLSGADEIERYLTHIRQVLNGTGPRYEWKKITCMQLAEMLREAAVQVAAAGKLPVLFHMDVPEGEVYASPESILRAWKNLLGNAAEYTDTERGLEIRMTSCFRKGQKYMVASVRDYGPGFSPRDLAFADREFYRGDNSRHDRRHQGLGLAIAKKLMEEQGGMLSFGNHPVQGAETACWIKTD